MLKLTIAFYKISVVGISKKKYTEYNKPCSSQKMHQNGDILVIRIEWQYFSRKICVAEFEQQV